MAYLSKEMKKDLSEKVKAVLPKGWKATFKNRDLMDFQVTIVSAPINLADLGQSIHEYEEGCQYVDFNHYQLKTIKDETLHQQVKLIIDTALSQNTVDIDDRYGNDHTYYLTLRFGRFEKGFISTLKNETVDMVA